MKKATSAGGIFVKKEQGRTFLLLLCYPEFGDYGFLKGHVEQGETFEEAAIREVREEAGLKGAVIVKKLGEVVREAKEKSGEEVVKTIHLFLMRSDNFDHQSAEENYLWVEYQEALGRMAFKEETEFLRKIQRELLEQ